MTYNITNLFIILFQSNCILKWFFIFSHIAPVLFFTLFLSNISLHCSCLIFPYIVPVLYFFSLFLSDFSLHCSCLIFLYTVPV